MSETKEAIAYAHPHEMARLAELVKAGWQIVAHKPFCELTEAVQWMVTEKLNKLLEATYGLVSLQAQLRDMLRDLNPSVTFYQKEAFNLTTEKKETVRDCELHDTENRDIATRLGVSLGKFYSELKPIQS